MKINETKNYLMLVLKFKLMIIITEYFTSILIKTYNWVDISIKIINKSIIK